MALRLPFLTTRLVFVTALATGLSAGAAAGAAMGAPVCDAAWAVVDTASGMARTAALARIDRNFFMMAPMIERGTEKAGDLFLSLTSMANGGSETHM